MPITVEVEIDDTGATRPTDHLAVLPTGLAFLTWETTEDRRVATGGPSADGFAMKADGGAARLQPTTKRIDPLKADYRLTPAESARIPCTANLANGERCDQQATWGQNHGGAPFWYHCDHHATMLRELGRTWVSTC